MSTPPRLVVIDQSPTSRSPAGSCVLAQIQGLMPDHHVTVFADQWESPPNEHLVWKRVAVPRKPLLLRYVAFQALVRLRVLAWRLAGGRSVLVQATQGQFVGADIVYAHFCHRAYLQDAWKKSGVTGPRRWARWLNHRFNAYTEARAVMRASRVVVPSLGLARELAACYPGSEAKLATIPNPVDVDRFGRPQDFDRRPVRAELGLRNDSFVFAFIALGDFSRKGLGLVIEALAALPQPLGERAEVLVVGGQAGEIDEFRQLARRHLVEDKIRFAGLQSDVRPHLWCADAFVFPSTYETFSLVIHQAAAAGLPLVVSRGLYGVEDLVHDGVNGWAVERDAASIRVAMETMLQLPEDELRRMAAAAQRAVQRCHPSVFVDSWRRLYADMLGTGSGDAMPATPAAGGGRL
ncbi:glycosyltransferase family 4 protein [Schlegelella sp. S2-27]|uniref:Glycosyltransferase family 4 protein n=1 Tax=Caldimonas mangrovi TaxID=2944811 RepID=A0ABT0YSS0_9BURK|nr:glycosyltransferase family 4 protein [Caldimonas mangrovi]MCM5681332.1 glycosyltransferase family 4 protein [Caldimonas mangrovi]